MGPSRHTHPIRGREDALSALAARVAAPGITTLWGPGGSGKTRLAEEVAARGRRERREVGFASVGPQATGDELLAGVLGAMQVPNAFLGTARADVRIARWLGRLSCPLVVLDEAEIALEAVRAVAPTLGDAGAHVLVTARSPVEVPGEHLQRVEPLDSVAAAELFRDAAPRGMFLDPADVARVVALLHGMPMAIERAAARLEVVPLRVLLQRLESPLQTLRAPSQDGRHAAVADSLDMSFGDLAEWARPAAAQLAIFAQDIALDAAEAIVEIEPPHTSLDLLHLLVRRSLARPLDTSEARIRLGPFVREFLADQPRPAGVEDRHATWFGERGLHFTRARHRGEDIGRWLEVEEPDLWLVVRRGLAREVGATALARSAAAWVYAVNTRRSAADRLRVVQSVFEVVEGQDCDAHALVTLHQAHGVLLARCGQVSDGRLALERGLALARRCGDQESEPALLGSLSNRYSELGDHTRAVDLLRESLDRAARIGHPRAECVALLALTLAEDWEHDWRPERSLPRLERAAALASGSDDHANAAVHVRLGQLLVCSGRPEASLAEFERGLVCAERAWSPWAMSSAWLGRGEALVLLGRSDEVEPLLERAVREGTEGMCFDVAAEALFELWLVAVGRGDLPAAEGYLGRVAAVLEGTPRHYQKHRLMAAVMRAVTSAARSRDAQARAELTEAVGLRDGEEPPYAGVWPFGEAALGLLALRRTLGPTHPSPDAEIAACRAAFDAVEPRYVAFLVTARRWLDTLSEACRQETQAWLFSRDGTTGVGPAGQRLDCTRYRSTARLLATLAEARLTDPGRAVSAEVLFRRGWSGEVISERSARNRLHVALHQLRRMGLDTLQRIGGGYRLDPDKPARWADP